MVSAVRILITTNLLDRTCVFVGSLLLWGIQKWSPVLTTMSRYHPKKTPRNGHRNLSLCFVKQDAAPDSVDSSCDFLMGVFKNRGTPKSSILIVFSIIYCTIHFGGFTTPIFGNILIVQPPNLIPFLGNPSTPWTEHVGIHVNSFSTSVMDLDQGFPWPKWNRRVLFFWEMVHISRKPSSRRILRSPSGHAILPPKKVI